MKQVSDERRIRRGYAIMAALFLAAVFIFNVDGVVGWFQDHIELVALVPQTNGVTIGSTVLVEGVEAGRVIDVGFVDLGGQGAVALELRMPGDVRSVLRRGSRAHTAKQRFVGEPTVRLTAGPVDAPPLESGDTIYPSDRPTLESLLEQGKDFPGALDSLAATLSLLQGVVESKRPGLARLTEQLALASREAETLRQSFDGAGLERWLNDPEVGVRIQRVQDHLRELNAAASELGRYGPGGELGDRAATLGERAERLAVALERLQQQIGDGDGVLGRVRQDSALAVAVRRVQAQIDSLRAEGLGFALRTLIP